MHDAAVGMISISDNTATDLLIDEVGREAVEDAVIDYGHHDPEELQPFLTTREMFQLLDENNAEVRAEFLDGSTDNQREILETLSEEPLPEVEDIDYSTGWNDEDSVSWLASAADISTVHQELAERMGDSAELEEILTTNPGLLSPPEDDEEFWWDAVAFKGGSQPGVYTGSWTAFSGDKDTATTVVLLAHSDDADLVEENGEEISGLGQDLLTLVESEQG